MKKLNWIIILAVILLPAALSMACPMCKDSIPSSDAASAGGVPLGFNFSVYYLLGGFFASLTMCIGVMTKGVRDTPR